MKSLTLILAICLATVASTQATTSEDDNWEVMSAQLPGVDGSVNAFATMGNRLFAGGRFRVIGGLVTGGIASWDGARWSALGTGINGGGVEALLVRGSDLIVGGDFVNAGGVAATNIARWDGAKWNALGNISSHPFAPVLALADFNGEIYAGGNFQTSDGAPANYLVRGNGGTWSPVGGGVDGIVYALHVMNGALYAGGAFVNAGGQTVNGVAKWDGVSWQPLDQGIRGGLNAVYALSSITTNLYVGGNFSVVGSASINAPGLARWIDDGSKSKWVNLSGVGPVTVFGLRAYQGRLFVGGRFSQIGGAASQNVVELTAAAKWVGFGPGVSNVNPSNPSDVRAIEPFGSDIFCGGFFETAGDQFIPSIARWTGSAWTAAGGGRDLGLNELSQEVKVVGSRVYVLGIFTLAGSTPNVRGAAEWTGAGWLRMADGIPTWRQAYLPFAATDGRDLYATLFGNAGATPFVHRWDGANWSAVGAAGVRGPVAVGGSNVFAVGTFSQGYGVARLQGGVWEPLGGAFARTSTGVNIIQRIAASGSNVYAGGTFETVGGEPIARIAHWDGLEWKELGASTPLTGGIVTLTASGNRLYVGQTGGAILIWDGSTWNTLPGLSGRVASIVPDGSDLWVGGGFQTINGLTVNNIARWDGTRWNALGSGVTGLYGVNSLAVTSDKLYVAGGFATAGGRGSRNFAIWHKVPVEVEIIVNSTGDEPDADPEDGVPDVDLQKVGLQTTLRAAIEFANHHRGKDTIQFKIPPEDPKYAGGVPLIQPKTGLPAITESLTIDGWTQAPAATKPPVELNGSTIPGTLVLSLGSLGRWPENPSATNGITIRASNCRIAGLVINQFPLFGINFEGDGNVIQGNFLGTDAPGLQPKANGITVAKDAVPHEGFLRGGGIFGEGSQNLIGGAGALGNLISGTTDGYAHVSGTDAIIAGPPLDLDGSSNIISGNFVGTDFTGIHVIGGTPSREQLMVFGISVSGVANLIGGSKPSEGNIIIGILNDAVHAVGRKNRVIGNRIGLGRDGRAVFSDHPANPRWIRNRGDGIKVTHGVAGQIGGLTPGEGNLIGSSANGITVTSDSGFDAIRIEGNLIGVEADGITPTYNDGSGLRIEGGVTGALIISNIVAYNYNAFGISLAPFYSHATEEFKAAPTDSLIFHNRIFSNFYPIINPFGVGISVEGQRNRISQNEIHDHPSAGIRLIVAGSVGPVPNDFGDLDSGPNTLLNYPVITLAQADDLGLQVQASLDTTVGVHNYTIEFFANRAACPSGYGEGERYLGSVSVNTDLSGRASFDFSTSQPVGIGEYVTATATDAEGNTSEFSRAVMVQDAIFSFPQKGISNGLQQQVPGGNGSLHSINAGIRGNLQLQGGVGDVAAGSARVPRAVEASRRDIPNDSIDPSAQVSGATPETAGGTPALPQSTLLPQSALATGDGNGDGIQDYLQPNVVSFPGISGKWITLASPKTTALENVSPSGTPDFKNIPAGYTFPLGFVNFTVTGLKPGSNVVVTNFFHDEIDYDTVFAYGPTPDEPKPHWYEFLFDGGAGAQIDLNGFTLTFIDGDVGDHDLLDDGGVTTTLAAAHKIPPGPQLTLLSTTVSTAPRAQFTPAPNGSFVLATNLVPIVTSVLAWPASASGYALQFADDLSPTNFWRTDFTAPAVRNNQNVVTNITASGTRFFRLRKF